MQEKVDKKKISDQLNEILGTKIDFTKLSVKELEELYSVFTTPSKFAQAVAKATKTKLSDKILNMRLKEFIEGTGPIGLGIIPTLFDGLGLGSKKDKGDQACSEK
jgi:hypothetical protein